VMVAPMIPALNDQEMEAILERAAEAGARAAGIILLRLPHELKDIFSEWLAAHAPDRAAHVLSQVRDTRGGRLNDAQFKSRMNGTGPRAELMAKRFSLACKRFGLTDGQASGFELDACQFSPPPRIGDQLRLL
ncbi:MAG: radical SAM protein, partial [Proteobacteria bacterium]|nr:radical SAM protein [Pseudomonadota bacterium]